MHWLTHWQFFKDTRKQVVGSHFLLTRRLSHVLKNTNQNATANISPRRAVKKRFEDYVDYQHEGGEEGRLVL